jgi:23S rRNA (uridine2552-2'-O)-methyltransferase
VFKLDEIDQRHSLLKPGNRVLDLGCSPGSWMQYAARRVGAKGLVVGVDLSEITIALPDQVLTLVGDVFEIAPETLRAHAERFDVVLSDMAPATSGVKFADAARSADLVRRANELALELLVPGGHLLAKVFEGAETQVLLGELRQSFTKATRIKPKSSRSESKETFLLALQLKSEIR